MRKIRAAALILLVLAMAVHAAAAQTLPGIDCFSPGLMRVSALEAEHAPVTAEAQMTIDKAVYARDLSVLASMLSGATIRYEGAGGTERLSILKEGSEVFSATLAGGEDGAALEIGGRAYALDSGRAAIEALSGVKLPGYEQAEGIMESLTGVPMLERVPLADVCAWLEGLCAGDVLLVGFAVTEPFAVKKTMSDDGTRLTRIDISGQIAREGEAPYVITGFLRQPAGRAPKDTFELVLKQDEKNFFELSYSAQRENTVASKNKRGTVNVRTSLKAAGKIAGSRISSRLTVTMKNDWTADGENLGEKIAVTATLEHQDGRPGMRMFRLNTVNGKLKNKISLSTHETANDVIELGDQVTLELVMDDNACITAGADVIMRLGGAAPDIRVASETLPADELPEAIDDEILALSAALYPHLCKDAKEKAAAGL